MEGALEGATAWCTCKLALSLLFLPRLPPPRGPVGLCCCCLLLFSDAAVTAFLAFLCVSESWPTGLTPRGDPIALRSLLFLGRVYAAAPLLACPLVVLETLSGPRRSADDGGGGRRAAGFLCCLAAWVAVALDARRTMEEACACASACLRSADSLLACLPRLLGPVSTDAARGEALSFLLPLLLLLLLLTVYRRGCRRASAEASETLRRDQRPDGGRPIPGTPQTPASGHAVRPPAGRNQDRTETKTPLTFTAQEERRRCVRRHWGFPRPGLKSIIGLMGVLGIFVLPLVLGVNIVSLRTVHYLLETSVEALVRRSTPAARRFRGIGSPGARNDLEIC